MSLIENPRRIDSRSEELRRDLFWKVREGIGDIER